MSGMNRAGSSFLLIQRPKGLSFAGTRDPESLRRIAKRVPLPDQECLQRLVPHAFDFGYASVQVTMARSPRNGLDEKEVLNRAQVSPTE